MADVTPLYTAPAEVPGVSAQITVDRRDGRLLAGGDDGVRAIEADSWTFHATRKVTGVTVRATTCSSFAGWRVLRFAWEQVMHDQAYVRWVLAELTRPVGRPDVDQDARRSA